MTDRRTIILPSDIDPHGNVVVWDHGPREPPADLDRASPEYQALVADANAWHKRHGDGPAALTMDVGNARHSLAVEPDRYALEPFDADDAEIEAEIEAIRQRRADAEAAAEEHRANLQYALDRKAAIAGLLARRAAEDAAEAEPAPPEPRPAFVPEPPAPPAAPPAPEPIHDPLVPAPAPQTVAEVHHEAEDHPQ